MELHAKFMKRASSWTNTVEGSRRKKQEERQRRLDELELARQKVDQEEAKLQLDLRKATIERANRLMREDNDQQKSFTAKLMLCDVLAEREAQVRLNDELKKLDRIREDRYLQMEKLNRRKLLEREIKEKEAKEALSKLTAKVQREQLVEYKEKRFREIEDQMLEGELIRTRTLQDLQAETIAEKKRRQAAVQALRDTQKANEYLKQLKAEDVLREEREEQKIKEYAERKEQMLQLRKQKEDEVFREKLAMRQAMIDAQAKRLAAMQQNEEARVERDVQAKDDADRRAAQDKAERMRRWAEDIDRSRQAQIERKHNQRQQKLAEEVESAHFSKLWCHILDQQDQQERETKRSAAKALAEEYKKQVEIQRLRHEEAKRLDSQVASNATQHQASDSSDFLNFAEQCIRSYAAEGKNVIPLIKELKEWRKKSQAL